MKTFCQFSALLIKILYTCRRNSLSSILELFIPLIFIILLILIQNDPEPNQGFKNETFTLGMKPQHEKPDYSYSLCTYYQSLGGFWGYGLVGNSILTQFLHQHLSSHPIAKNLTAKFFDNGHDLEKYIKSKDYNNNMKLCFAIQTENFNNKEIEISFRSNSSYAYSEKSALLGSYIDVYNFYRTETATEALLESDPNFMFQYLTSGFLQTLNFVSNFALRTKGINKEIITNIKGMNKTKMKRESKLIFIKSLIALFSYMGYLIPMCRMISAVIKEREDRMKELLLIMGMSNNCYWSAWLFHYFCLYTILSAFVSMIVVEWLYTKSEFIWVFLLYWLYGIFCVFYSQLISVFFYKAKIAVFASIIIILISYLIGYGLSSADALTKTFVSFIPCIGFHLALDTVSDLEIINLGLTRKTVNLLVKNMKISDALILYPITIIIFAILAIYFENVLPSGFKNKKWNFFIRLCCSKHNKVENSSEIDYSTESKFFENVDPALAAQKISKQAMIIRGLSKSFNDRKIIENINLELYEGQIFALLGHNGSGKTTTIHSIIGSIIPNSGDITLRNLSLSKDLEKIRKMIGVCLQENILFPVLTPYEHIKIFSVIKGISFKLITDEFILSKLTEVKLLEAKDTPAEKLSGGQKRKLCLAIALLGNSKIIILDEPTSGMDLNSRRCMWDLLKNNKTERIIILTTHYMEEADILSDRVAMLINGSVRCCGSPLYLKSIFGGGYYLSLLKTQKIRNKFYTEKIISFMQQRLKNDWKIVNDFQNEVTFQLPFDFIAKSLDFFQDLEDNMLTLELQGYSISVTTLEEVFMKVMQLKSEENLEFTERQAYLESAAGPEETLLKNTEKVDSKSNQFSNIMKKRFIISKRDVKATLIEILCPGFFIFFTLGMVNWKFLDSETEKLLLTNDLYPNDVIAYNSFPASDEFMANCDLDSIQLNSSKFESKLKPNLDDDLYAGVYFNDLNQHSRYINYTLYPNQKILHSSAYYNSKLAECILLNEGITLKLKVNNYPFPLTYTQSLVFSLPSSFILTTGLAIGFGFVPSYLIVLLSHEKTIGIKHLHRISGLSIFIYWIGNFIWDMLKQFLMVLITISIVFITDFTMLEGNSNYSMMCSLFFAYSLNSTLFSYLLSFVFKNSSSAFINSLIIHLLTGCLFPLLLLIILNHQDFRSFMIYFFWILRLFPNFSLNWGIIKITNSVYLATITDLKNTPNDLSWEGSGKELFMLLLNSLLCIFGILIAEIIESRPYLCSRAIKMDSGLVSVNLFESDVEVEARRANQTDPVDVVVNVKNLFKVFQAKGGPKIAIDDLSFNVCKGECFSLLGVNGAGKTTTFKILTGLAAPTKGSVFIHGFNLRTQMSQARQELGYCPQYDALNEVLTARETLELYSSFRNIPKSIRKNTVNKILDLVDLTEHADYRCGHYSGGNKRKLSLGISILGLPELVILDEPTAGMDPESRKKVWKLINELKTHQCSVLLTSHSMEEAESVSDRITIMVRGKFQCLGSPAYVKQKYGDHFELQIKIENPGQDELDNLTTALNYTDKKVYLNREMVLKTLKTINLEKYYEHINQKSSGSALYWNLEKGGVLLEDFLTWVIIEQSGENLIKFLKECFCNVIVEEHYLTYFKIRIINDKNLSLGKIFHLIESNKNILRIAGYSLSQTSLDQIFNKFAQDDQGSVDNTINPVFHKFGSFLSTDHSKDH